jgi:hypothetical protein
LSKPFPAQKSSKPKEIIDLGVISLRSYQLSPPSPSEPSSAPSPSGSSKLLSSDSSIPSSSPIVRHITPAQLLAKLQQKDITARKYMPPQRRLSPTPVTTRISIVQGYYYCHNKHGREYRTLARSHYHQNKCP